MNHNSSIGHTLKKTILAVTSWNQEGPYSIAPISAAGIWGPDLVILIPNLSLSFHIPHECPVRQITKNLVYCSSSTTCDPFPPGTSDRRLCRHCHDNRPWNLINEILPRCIQLTWYKNCLEWNDNERSCLENKIRWLKRWSWGVFDYFLLVVCRLYKPLATVIFVISNGFASVAWDVVHPSIHEVILNAVVGEDALQGSTNCALGPVLFDDPKCAATVYNAGYHIKEGRWSEEHQ